MTPKQNARHRLFAVFLTGCSLFAASAFSETTPTVELNEAGEPLKSNERKVRREDFDEAYWGIHLKDITDEFIMQKGEETLFIDAGGQIFIKKKAPWYPGETGKSYGSTEEMLEAEKRWDELAEYNRKVRANQGIVFDSKPEFADPERRRLVLIPHSRAANKGQEIKVDLWVAGPVSHGAQPLEVGLALAFDPTALKFLRIENDEKTQIAEQRQRIVREDKNVLRLRLGSSLQADQPHARVAVLVFQARERGEATLEPLSLSTTAKSGVTFLALGENSAKPEANPVTISIK